MISKFLPTLAKLAFCAVALVAATAHAQTTALWLDFVPGQGSPYAPATRLYQPGAYTLQFQDATSSRLSLSVTSASDFTNLEMSPPTGQSFIPGPYETVEELQPSAMAAGMRICTISVPCDFTFARFVVLEATFDAGSNLVTFAADFEQRSFDGSTYYGELRYNSAIPFTMDKPVSASSPDAFAFPARTELLTGQPIDSNNITVYGIRSPAPISVSGGEYSVNGGPFTVLAGTAANRDHIVVRVISASAPASTTSAVLTVGGASASFNVTTYVPGAPFTAVSFDSGSTPNFSGATNLLAQAPDWNISATADPTGHRVFIDVRNANGERFTTGFQAPFDAPLAVGPYEEAYYSSIASPVLDPVSGATTCGALSGRFVIHELVLSTPPNIDRLAASFDEWCTTGDPLIGEIRVNSSMPLPAMLGAPRTTPYPFALSTQSPVRPGTIVSSNQTTIDGIDQAVPISIVGGEYSLNGAPFTTTSATASPSDHIVVRLTASQTPGGVSSATLSVGGRSGTLSVTTYQQGMALTGIYYRNPTAGANGLGDSQLILAPPSALSVTAPQQGSLEGLLKAFGGTGSVWTIGFATVGGVPLTVGSYMGAERYRFQPPSVPGFDFSGPAAGCNESISQFAVREAVYALDGTPQRFAADFEQRCVNVLDTSPTYGELRFNSTVPFSALMPPVAPLANIATRGDVLTGDNVVIGGFIIGGSTNKTVAITGTGPSLASFGVTNPLANPTLTLVRSSDQTVIAANDDWQAGANAAQLQASGFAPPDPSEAGLLVNLPPGAYTAILQGAGGGTGVGVVGVFEVDHPETPLINIATRGLVQTGENVLIGGFIIHGTGPQTVAVVATGPSLSGFGITNPLADPTLTLVRSSDQSVIATNDDWQSASNFVQLQQTGFAPPDAHESGILVTLDPGAYTAILSGKAGATGVGVVAVYTVQ